MKKALSLALAIVLAFSCMTVAFAADPILVTSITPGATSTSIKVGGSYTLSATVAPTTATTKTVAYSTSAADIATVSTSGVITGVAVGTATITIAAQDTSGVIATCEVTVAEADATEAVVYTCPYCGTGDFYTAEMYHAHLDTCPSYTANYVDMSVSEILAYLLKVIDLDNARLGIIKPIIANIVDYVNDFIKGLISSDSGVKGAVSDLEAKLGEFKFDIGSGKLKDILDALKAKIKALYCGEPATSAEPPVDSGSSATAGIAVFAAVSVAAAAAYVCTRKKDEE